MKYEADRDSALKYRVATVALIAINCVVFIAYTVVSHYRPSVQLVDFGADWGPLTVTGQWWRLLTSNFIHGNIFHLCANLIFLWLFGIRVERILGLHWFAVFYLLCCIASGLGSMLMHVEGTAYGASAAVFGLAGFLAGRYGIRMRGFTRWQGVKFSLLLLWIVGNLYPYTPATGSDTAAHIIGLSVGLTTGIAFSLGVAKARWQRQAALSVSGLILISVATGVRLYNPYLFPLRAASLAFDQNRTADAMRFVTAALALKPKSFTANVLEAEIYFKQSNYQLMEASARRAIAVDEGSSYSLYLLGIAQLRTGRCDEAREIARQLGEQHAAEGRLLASSACYHKPS